MHLIPSARAHPHQGHISILAFLTGTAGSGDAELLTSAFIGTIGLSSPCTLRSGSDVKSLSSSDVQVMLQTLAEMDGDKKLWVLGELSFHFRLSTTSSRPKVDQVCLVRATIGQDIFQGVLQGLSHWKRERRLTSVMGRLKFEIEMRRLCD